MKKKVMVKIMNNIIEQIQKRLVECDEYLAKSKVDSNYHMCQGQRQIYASALERPDAISPGFVQSLISENYLHYSTSKAWLIWNIHTEHQPVMTNIQIG